MSPEESSVKSEKIIQITKSQGISASVSLTHNSMSIFFNFSTMNITNLVLIY